VDYHGGMSGRLWRLSDRRRLGHEPSLLEGISFGARWRAISIGAGPALALLGYFLVRGVPESELPMAGKLTFGVFLLAAWYWLSGALPPFATAILVMALLVMLVGLPVTMDLADGTRDAVDGSRVIGWEQFISPASSPVIVLMLGGFVLGAAAQRHRIDRELATMLLRPLGGSPRRLMLGVMIATATLSMWMSNTATAVMMLAMLGPILAQLEPGSRVRRAIALSVPLAANVGGVGTPIGTPPNAIAFGAMRGMEDAPTFLGWMLFGVPLAAMLVAIGWAYLVVAYRVGRVEIPLDFAETEPSPTWARRTIIGTFFVTVALWITSPWTGVPVAVAALVPIVVFTATKLLDRDDINRLDWATLLLMAGGLALGTAMDASGLASWAVEKLPIAGTSALTVLAILGLTTLMLSNFMSNTAVANLLLPMAFAMAPLVSGVGAIPMGIVVALSASLGMALPVSTPPNAIAFASGSVSTGALVVSGIVVGFIGLTLVILTAMALRFLMEW